MWYLFPEDRNQLIKIPYECIYFNTKIFNSDAFAIRKVISFDIDKVDYIILSMLLLF